jgi:hypothetical protein
MSDLTCTIPMASHMALFKEMKRKKAMMLKADFVNGDETIPELCKRYELEQVYVSRMANKENWVVLRQQKRVALSEKLIGKATERLETNQVLFLGDCSLKLNKLSTIINKELDRIHEGMPDGNGEVPTVRELLQVAKTMESFIVMGRKTYLLENQTAPVQEAEILDVLPISRKAIDVNTQ